MIETITRKEAKERGLKQYFTGKPCLYGHVGERYTLDARCVDCRKGYARELYTANKSTIKSRVDSWRSKNDQSVKEIEARRRHKHKEARNEVGRKWYANNKSRCLVKSNQRRARKANAEGSHTVGDLVAIRAAQDDSCIYCGVKLYGKGHWDHKTPLSRGGYNWPTNMQLTCQSCNDSKGTLTDEEFRKSRRYERRIAGGH